MSAFRRRNAISSSRSVPVSDPSVCTYFFGSSGFSGIKSAVSPDYAYRKVVSSRWLSSPTILLVVDAIVQNECGYNTWIRLGEVTCAKLLSLKLMTLSAMFCLFLPVCCSLSSTGFLAGREVVMLTTLTVIRFHGGEGSDPSPSIVSELWSGPLTMKIEMARPDQLFNLSLEGLTVLYGVSERSIKVAVLCQISSLRLLKWFWPLKELLPWICMRMFERVSVKGVRLMGP
ncbi:hypothetical protein Nepgr_005729 [Nepenthes gracilis]|uniref:Uncharacterized protein n=1 Tax=Nepenthes gracilis TaxID=150966 RepID=A0AAD3S421_NEPGR|nr:hypothetical protein Nepgr_005729 [Nepenthes gracilis]